MKPTSNRYALAALRERRAALAGEVQSAETRLRQLRDSLAHVDGTLRLFDPEFDPAKIKLKKPRRRPPLFGRGKINRLIQDALRKAGKPLRLAEIVAAIEAETGFGPEAATGLKRRVSASLLYLAKARGSVVKEGERETAAWRLAPVE